MKKFIFYCPSQEKLAQELRIYNGENMNGTILWKEFPDGFPNLRVLTPERLVNSDVVFLADFNDPKEIFRQMAVLYALPSYGINSLKVVLPFFPTGTMDRACNYGEVVTAKTLARMLSAIPMAACPTQIYIFDIHSQQEQFFFSDNVRVHCASAIDLFKNKLDHIDKDDCKLAVAFPDEGAYKRFGSGFKNYHKIVCEKRRGKNGERVITIKEGNPKDRMVYIFDDLILSGSTMLECARVLNDAGAVKVKAYATHGVFPQESWRKFVDQNIALNITNSCPQSIAGIDKNLIECGEITILSLFSEIARITK